MGLLRKMLAELGLANAEVGKDDTARSGGRTAVLDIYESMSKLGIELALVDAGFLGRTDTREGFAVQFDDNRFKVMWSRFHHDAREANLPAMCRALRAAGYRARVARKWDYPYVSVTGPSQG